MRRHSPGIPVARILAISLAASSSVQAAPPAPPSLSAAAPDSRDMSSAEAPTSAARVDENLYALVVAAISSHPSIAAARANLRASGADLRAAKWQRFPSFSIEGMMLDEKNNARQASAVIDQPIWTGGRISSSISRATAQGQAALAAYWEAVLEIELNVAQNFREYHRLSLRIDSLTDSLTQHRKLVQTMERRVAQEVSPLSDLELVRSRAAQVQQQVTVTTAQRRSVLQKLRELVGDPGLIPAPPEKLAGELPELGVDTLTERTLAFDPSRHRLLSEAKAARAEASASRASILPQLSGQYSYNETYGHRVGLVLKAQSDGGLSRFASASAAKARQQSAELKVANVERDLRDRVISDLAEYDSARERLASTQTAADSTLRVTASYMRQFISGRRTWLDVMNAVRESSAAQNDAIDAEASALEAYDRLMMRSGSWKAPSENKDAQ